jgi:hypothetical protein
MGTVASVPAVQRWAGALLLAVPEGEAAAMRPECAFGGKPGAGPCSGALIRAHLIPKQLTKREFPHGVVFENGTWRRLDRTEDRYDLPHRTLREIHDDPRSWVPCCGGGSGIGGHHGQLDGLKLRIQRAGLPPAVEEFAAELGLGWWLDRTYGEAARAA